MPFHETSSLSSLFSSDNHLSPQLSNSDLASSHTDASVSYLFSINYCNCGSLLPKLDTLHVEAVISKPCIFTLVKTWLDSNIADTELCIPGYSIMQCDRNSKGCGILMYVKNYLPIALIASEII